MFFESPQHIAPTCKYCRTLNNLELYPTLAPWITIFAASALSFRVGVKHHCTLWASIIDACKTHEFD